MKILRSLLLLPALLVFSLTSGAVTEFTYEYEEEHEEVASIPALSSLAEVADSARSKGVPILIELSTPWCRYCEALEQQVLGPLILNGKYRDRLIVKKLEVNTYSSITGFDGRVYQADQISRHFGVDLYPTLVFFDADGREISQRIVGITVLEYVAGELEQAIDRAIEASGETL